VIRNRVGEITNPSLLLEGILDIWMNFSLEYTQNLYNMAFISNVRFIAATLITISICRSLYLCSMTRDESDSFAGLINCQFILLYTRVVVVIAKNTERVNNLSLDSVVSFFKTDTLYLCLSIIFAIVLTKNIVPS
jgi:hypothetical protein